MLPQSIPQGIPSCGFRDKYTLREESKIMGAWSAFIWLADVQTGKIVKFK
jgi:hypothetical protein